MEPPARLLATLIGRAFTATQTVREVGNVSGEFHSNWVLQNAT